MGRNGLRYLENVTTLSLDVDKCTGCGLCAEVCPHAVFVIEKGLSSIVDRDACMECGACAKNCPEEAITVRAGVGCAGAVLTGAIRGTEPCCGDSKSGACC